MVCGCSQHSIIQKVGLEVFIGCHSWAHTRHIWYQAPEDLWKKARWMGFAYNAGDAMTYYIKTEESPFKYSIRSVICTRQQHVWTEREHMNEDSSLQLKLREIELDCLNKDDEVILDDTIGRLRERVNLRKGIFQ
eukprot:7844946-Ditylum_brightwellii.AAC.1